MGKKSESTLRVRGGRVSKPAPLRLPVRKPGVSRALPAPAASELGGKPQAARREAAPDDAPPSPPPPPPPLASPSPEPRAPSPPPGPLAAPFAAALPPFPAPSPFPRDCSSADLAVGHLGSETAVQDAKFGRGLFAARRLAAGALVSRYDGDVHSEGALPAGAPRTHVARMGLTRTLVDGRPLADSLARIPGSPRFWHQPVEALRRRGYGSLANAAATHAKANCRIVFLPDDGAARKEGYDAANPAPLGHALRGLLPRGAYLVAKRDIKVGEELTWKYQWSAV